MRRQKNPKRDQESTDAFHRWLSALKTPRRPIDGVKWDVQKYPLD
jgi:hypothetical protein